MKIHHLGLVTSHLDETLRAFGLSKQDIVETVYDPIQKNNLHFIPLPGNDLYLELVEPVSPGASTYNFAKMNGHGLHHLGFETADFAERERYYATRPGAFKLGQYEIEVKSFGGKIRTLFFAVKGLILEYVRPDV